MTILLSLYFLIDVAVFIFTFTGVRTSLSSFAGAHIELNYRAAVAK